MTTKQDEWLGMFWALFLLAALITWGWFWATGQLNEEPQAKPYPPPVRIQDLDNETQEAVILYQTYINAGYSHEEASRLAIKAMEDR